MGTNLPSLLSLPVMTGDTTCQNCGSKDWGSARTNGDVKIVMCDKCPDVPKDWDALKEMQ